MAASPGGRATSSVTSADPLSHFSTLYWRASSQGSWSQNDPDLPPGPVQVYEELASFPTRNAPGDHGHMMLTFMPSSLPQVSFTLDGSALYTSGPFLSAAITILQRAATRRARRTHHSLAGHFYCVSMGDQPGASVMSVLAVRAVTTKCFTHSPCNFSLSPSRPP